MFYGGGVPAFYVGPHPKTRARRSNTRLQDATEVGRPERDARHGQAEPVTAFYAVSEDGSDPPMQDVLGLKEAQRSALVDGQASGAVLEGADSDRIKKLAAAYLERRG